MPVSADALLRRAKKQAPAPSTPRVLGVEDCAFRRGHTSGSILIDLESHKPVDVLEDRSVETFAEWLRQHPGVEIISRDRSKDSARGATDGAPQAQQVIDRWHGLKNLREAIERLLPHTPGSEEAKGKAGHPSSPRPKRTSGERVRSTGSRARRLALSQQVNELSQHGGTILGIARQLQIGAPTVRKGVRSPQFPEWGKPAVTRSAIDPYRTYLEERWRQGCQDAGSLWQELQARGFTGSRMMVSRWIQVRRDEPASASETGHKQTNRVPRRLAPRPLAWLDLA